MSGLGPLPLFSPFSEHDFSRHAFVCLRPAFDTVRNPNVRNCAENRIAISRSFLPLNAEKRQHLIVG